MFSFSRFGCVDLDSHHRSTRNSGNVASLESSGDSFPEQPPQYPGQARGEDKLLQFSFDAPSMTTHCPGCSCMPSTREKGQVEPRLEDSRENEHETRGDDVTDLSEIVRVALEEIGDLGLTIE